MRGSGSGGEGPLSSAAAKRHLLVVTRLGLRFDGAELQSREDFEWRLKIMKLAAARFVSSAELCVGWVIETDQSWFELLEQEIGLGELSGPPNGPVVVSRRGTEHEQDDLRRLELDNVPLLIVRLDSDDAYFQEALDRALELASGHPDGVLVDFPHGYLLAPATGELQKHSYVMQGPFHGFTASGPELDLIHRKHAEARSVASDVLLIDGRAWVQTVHGANLFTELKRGSLIVRLRQLRRSLTRNPAQRSLREFPRFLMSFTATRPSVAERARSSVSGREEWARS